MALQAQVIFLMRFLHTFILILKKIKTRPTKYFSLVVISIIGLFFLAYMHNYNIVYLVMFFVFSLAGASSIVGRLNLYELEPSVLVAQNFYADTSCSYTLSIYNPSERDSFAVECSNRESSSFIQELQSLQNKTINLECTPTKRGKFTLPALQIGSCFPIGHEILFFSTNLKHESIVYPKPQGESLEAFSSKHRSFHGEHEDFEGIRPYHEGESISLIHWPSLAKGQELMSKEFTLLEQSRHLHFHFSQAGEDDEQRLSQLCLWALECKQKKINYSMHFPNTTFSSVQRSHYEILQFLALY